jgi:UDPglucose--hexose-1-phosphate uridylyltransferase
VAELRTDWLTGRSIIVAENRAQRPNEFADQLPPAAGSQGITDLALAEVGLTDVPGVPSCPFCIGNEHRTPPALYERLDAHGRWQVRVVPNMFPAVAADAVAQDSDMSPALGAHEVIVESAQHLDRAAALSANGLMHVLDAYADRLRHGRNDGQFEYGLVFKNQGPRAGASIAHLHSQLIALPSVPPTVAAELASAETEFRRSGACAYCQLIERERVAEQRIVYDGNGFIAFCPYASLQPYEVWLLPERHEASFERMAETGSTEMLALVLRKLIEQIERIIPAAAYNLLLRTAPWKAEADNWYHWRIELLPRVNAFAGFEIATGMHINPVAPEKAARHIRSL